MKSGPALPVTDRWLCLCSLSVARRLNIRAHLMSRYLLVGIYGRDVALRCPDGAARRSYLRQRNHTRKVYRSRPPAASRRRVMKNRILPAIVWPVRRVLWHTLYVLVQKIELHETALYRLL